MYKFSFNYIFIHKRPDLWKWFVMLVPESCFIILSFNRIIVFELQGSIQNTSCWYTILIFSDVLGAWIRVYRIADSCYRSNISHIMWVKILHHLHYIIWSINFRKHWPASGSLSHSVILMSILLHMYLSVNKAILMWVQLFKHNPVEKTLLYLTWQPVRYI